MIDWNSGQFTFFRESDLTSYTAHRHQNKAWEKMNDYFVQNKAGIIHVPTGGGKTFIAGKWVWERILEGAQVLWITNFVTLLEQSAKELVKIYNSDLIVESDNHRTRTFNFLWGGTDISWDNVGDTSRPDIIFTTHASATRKKDDLFRYYQGVSNLVVIYDECHHAQGPATIKLIKKLKNIPNVLLIGITATPKCSNFTKTKKLWDLFDASKISGNKLRLNPIYSVGTKYLEEINVIAKAEFINSESGISEQDIRDACNLSPDDLLVDKFGNLLPCVENYLANNKNRLAKTYSEYVANPLFGKTIIFTINIRECDLLYNLFEANFQNNGKTVGRAHNERPDKKEVMKRFQDGELDVLINVNMATEGYNAPQTNTVIITRPIRSDSQVLQMVGRGIRGEKAGGNAKCYLVSIDDKWGKDNEVINLERLYELQAETEVIFESPLEAISDFFDKIYPRFPPHPMMHKHWYLPQAYIDIGDNFREDDINMNSNQNFLLLPRHQWDGLNAYHKSGVIIPAQEVMDQFFADCPDPLLSLEEIEIINDILRDGTFNDAIIFVEPSDLDKLSPEKPHNKNHVFWKYFCNDEVSSQKKFSLEWKKFQEDACTLKKSIDEGIKTEIQSSPKNREDFIQFLHELYSELKLPGNPCISVYDSQYCSDKRLGFCRLSKEDGKVTIVINSLLNRQVVPRMVLEFLFFHLSKRAEFPYDPLGLIFAIPKHKEFIPSDIAREEIKNPSVKKIFDSFCNASQKVTYSEDSSEVCFCKGFLMIYGLIINEDGDYSWY
jgi:superfamily II DNA or RNA helicase